MDIESILIKIKVIIPGLTERCEIFENKEIEGENRDLTVTDRH